ncbi:MAG: hypothetical protein OXC31_20920 [Spirochaetaceae bacterium]|nr:hypothetical protein [Spirochaetaceae bacterium]
MARIRDISVAGRRYESEVPDTLDLADRARLAIPALTRHLSPEADYGVGDDAGSLYLAAKFAEALPMVRAMCGDDSDLDVEQAMMASLVSLIDEDGLLYTPPNTPARRGGAADGREYAETDEAHTSAYGNARMMQAMLFWHQRDGDPAWLKQVQRMADGLRKVAVLKDDYAYYPDGGVAFDFSYLKESGYRNTEEPSSASEGFEGAALFYNSNQIGALCLWHATSGDRRALDLARRLTRFVLQPRFWHAGESPDVAGAERGHWRGHFHERMITLRALLWFAMATGDWRLKEFVRASYEHSRNYGLARIGWNPGWTGPHPLHRNERTCESCGIAGQVGLAVRLSQAGLGDYWDDVDGYVRNHLVEQQFADPELIERARSTCYPGSRNWLGGFCGPGRVTSLNNGYPARCCRGNGAQGLYRAWDGIMRCTNGAAQVNLLLNRASPWLDVDSHLPYEGRVVIRNKQARTVAVRLPAWADREAVESRVGRRRAAPGRVANYLVFEGVREGEELTVEFPMIEETAEYTVADGAYADGADGPELPATRYRCHFKGNTLVDIAPRDGRKHLSSPEQQPYPIYLRDHYLADRAPSRRVNRYIAPYSISW